MGELDVATIKSIFEKGSHDEAETPKGRIQERRRTLGALGLSPGLLHTNRKVIKRKSKKQVRVTSIPRLKKNETKKKGEKVDSDDKPSPKSQAEARKAQVITKTERRATLPQSYAFVAPQLKEDRNSVCKTKMKGAYGSQDKAPSPSSETENGSESIKPSDISGRRSFFDKNCSSIMNHKDGDMKKNKKLSLQVDEPKKCEELGLKKNKDISVSVKLQPKSEANDGKKKVKIAATESKKLSKFAYLSASKNRRTSAFAKLDHVSEQKKSKSNNESQIKFDPPPRRASLSDLPLPEDEIIDISDFQRMSSCPLKLDEQIEGKSSISREKEMLALKDRKRVSSMIQQFSVQSTPIQTNKSNRVKQNKKRLPLPPPPPPPVRESADQYTTDGSEIIEEETVVSEYTGIGGESGDYSSYYEEVTFIEPDEYEETDSIMLSSVGMDTISRASFDQLTPSVKSRRRVVVDFQNMETPSPKRKEKHLKVVADLEMLMAKTRRSQPETEIQRTMKEKMMQDLFQINNKSWVTETLRESLKQADLTVHEVSEIVAHTNMREETNSSIPWDLIKGIVYPDGIDDHATRKAFEEAMAQSTRDESSHLSSSRLLLSKSKANQLQRQPELGKAAAHEIFRNQYDLSTDDMANIVAHLTLCEETGNAIRWDLIYQIVYQEDMASVDDSQTDPGSMMIEVFDDNDTVTSWYSIYPEFDDCGSEITFNVDGDDDLGTLPKFKAPNEIGIPAAGVGSNVPKPGPVQRAISESSELVNAQLLRKRIQQLQLSSGKGSFQVHHRRKKGFS